mmetsp:Transcript_36760/g.65821  ORF Transcript_36760/g.65821 Transcript_36760/m.65821 type:complete len:432 (-) Transcript_36760:198-1493(-)
MPLTLTHRRAGLLPASSATRRPSALCCAATPLSPRSGPLRANTVVFHRANSARFTTTSRACGSTPQQRRYRVLSASHSDEAGVQPGLEQVSSTSAPSTTSEPAANTTETPEQRPWWTHLARTGGQAVAVAALALALVASSPLTAEAARSGGRMGGSAFRGAAPSRSYSAPSSPMRSGGMGMRSAPSVVVAPSYGMSSFFFPTYGYGYGMGMGGGGLFNLLFLGFAGFVIVSALSSMLSQDEDVTAGSGACSVVKLQVGLLGMARGLQADLDRIAGRADTSDPEGLQYVLQETVLALLRNPDYCIYGYSESSKANGLDDAESKFNEQSMGERSKFSSETLVNFGGRSKRGASGSTSDMSNELIVVTVVAAVDGRVKLPPISSLPDLKAALNKLGSVPADGLLAVEVLWTPQEEGDSFTRDEIVTDYPMLNQL